MADSLPNYRLEQIRLRAQIAGLQATVARQELELMEMLDRQERLDENIRASHHALSELESQLTGLEQQHGPFSSSHLAALRAQRG